MLILIPSGCVLHDNFYLSSKLPELPKKSLQLEDNKEPILQEQNITIEVIDTELSEFDIVNHVKNQRMRLIYYVPLFSGIMILSCQSESKFSQSIDF